MDIQPPSRETGIALPGNRRDDTAKDAVASEREQAGPTSAERMRRRHDDSEAGESGRREDEGPRGAERR